MVEAEESTELVHLTRTAQHAREADAPPPPPPPPPSLEDFAAALSREVAAVHASDGGGSAPLSSSSSSAGTVQREEPRQPDGAAFRQTRLAITAGLVVLLVLAWIWQRRSGLRR